MLDESLDVKNNINDELVNKTDTIKFSVYSFQLLEEVPNPITSQRLPTYGLPGPSAATALTLMQGWYCMWLQRVVAGPECIQLHSFCR